jgi:hypothetical protein
VTGEKKIFRTRVIGPHPFGDICDSLLSLFLQFLFNRVTYFLPERRVEVPKKTGKGSEVAKCFASKPRQKLAIAKLEDFDSFSQTGFSVLESRLQPDVPEPAFNGRNGLVVAVFGITN